MAGFLGRAGLGSSDFFLRKSPFEIPQGKPAEFFGPRESSGGV